jgi:hypothetical protein
MMLLPMLTLSQPSTEPILSIRDTLPDGRVFYIDVVKDSIHGELMRFDPVGRKMIRIINNDRVYLKEQNIILSEDIIDCEKEKTLKDKEISSLMINNVEVNEQYSLEKEKNINNSVMLKGYQKQANTGKIMTIVGGIGIGVGIAGILVAVIVMQ